MDGCAELRYSVRTTTACGCPLARFCLLLLLHPQPASQPASQPAGARQLWTQAGDCATMRAWAVCERHEREQRTRTQTYLTDALLLQCCCDSAANNAQNALCLCTPDGRRAVSYAAMRTCLSQLDAGALGACYSGRPLRRQTRCSDRRSIPSRRSVCLRSAAAARKINVFVSSNERTAVSMIEMPDVQQSYEQLCRIPRAARRSASRLQLGVKADSEREQHQPRKVLCSVGVACLSNARVQEATEGTMVVARWTGNSY